MVQQTKRNRKFQRMGAALAASENNNKLNSAFERLKVFYTLTLPACCTRALLLPCVRHHAIYINLCSAGTWLPTSSSTRWMPTMCSSDTKINNMRSEKVWRPWHTAIHVCMSTHDIRRFMFACWPGRNRIQIINERAFTELEKDLTVQRI